MTYIRIVAVVLLAAVASACSSYTSSERRVTESLAAPAGDRYQEGKTHFEQGRYGLAVAAFRAALQDESASVRALNGLAASYDRLGRFDLAERYYVRALALEPKFVQTLNNMGYSLMLKADRKKDRTLLAQAQGYFDKASEGAGRNPVIAGNLAQVERRIEPAPKPQVAKREPRKPLIAIAEPDRYAGWVERRSKRLQRLVTDPPQDLAKRLRATGVEPGLAANTASAAPPRRPHAESLVVVQLASAAPLSVLPPRVGPVTYISTVAAIGMPVVQVDRVTLQPLRVTVSGPVLAAAPISVNEPAAEIPTVVQLTAAPAPVNEPASANKPTVVQLTAAPAPGNKPAPVNKPAAKLPTAIQLASAAPLSVLPSRPEPVTYISTVRAIAVPVAQVETAALQPLVVATSAPMPAIAPAPAVQSEFAFEVSNGTGRLGMAKRFRGYLREQGLRVARLTNAKRYSDRASTLYYRHAFRARAEELSRQLPVSVTLALDDTIRSDVRLRLGADLLDFDARRISVIRTRREI